MDDLDHRVAMERDEIEIDRLKAEIERLHDYYGKRMRSMESACGHMRAEMDHARQDRTQALDRLATYESFLESKSEALAAALDRLDTALKMLEATPCPNNCQDQHVPYQVDEGEWSSYQCQWCCELDQLRRSRAVEEHAPVPGEECRKVFLKHGPMTRLIADTWKITWPCGHISEGRRGQVEPSECPIHGFSADEGQRHEYVDIGYGPDYCGDCGKPPEHESHIDPDEGQEP